MAYPTIGTEFTATMLSPEPLIVGSVVPARDGEDRTLEVIGLDGQTFSGAQWYRFRVVPAI